MAESSNSQTPEDELARRSAIGYAAATVHFVRRATRRINTIDPSDSFLQEVTAYHGHPGRPPIKVDQLAQEFLERVIKDSPPDRSLGDVIVLGEEAVLNSWSPNKSRGTVVFRCDPVDGTSNLSHCGDGFSAVVTVEWQPPNKDQWIHLGGAIVRNDGDGLSWSRRAVYRHDVVIDFQPLEPSVMPQILHREQLPAFSSWSIDASFHEKLIRSGATVAAHNPVRREKLLDEYQELVRRSGFFDFRSGTTSAWGLCNRRLGFVFEVNQTTIHDSAHLFPFAHLLGGKVVDHQYRPINVLALIEKNASPKSREKVIPPYIAYVDDQTLDFVRECLDESKSHVRS